MLVTLAWREDSEADRYVRFSLTRRGALLFAAMCIIWGIPYLMIRVAVRELAPVTMVFLRTGIAAALLVPLAARRGELRPLIAGWRPLLAYTAIEVALPWYLLGHAETKLTSSLTGLLIAAVPLVGALIVTLSGERARLGLRRWLGLLVGIVGVGAIVGLDIGNIDLLALGEVALVAVCYAVGPLILARRMGGTARPRDRRRLTGAFRSSSMHRSRPPTGRLRSRPRTWSSPSSAWRSSARRRRS